MQNPSTFVPPQQGALSNPLTMFMRQPKIYISLPSNGNYWPMGSLQLPETGKLPVYSMTAKDELLLNVPDALMNGQAVVDVIQNCIPSIKNAWATPVIDIDAILIAIRIATYGEIMKTPIKITEDFEMDYQVDLRTVLDSIMMSAKWESAIAISDDMTVFVRPLTYKQSTQSALQTFETQKIIQLSNNDSISEEDKIKMFKDSFRKLTDSTVGVIADSIQKIDTNQGSTENPTHIKDFINNADKDIFNKIKIHLEKLKELNSIKPAIIAVTDEMRAQGVTGDTVEIPLIFDASTFFA